MIRRSFVVLAVLLAAALPARADEPPRALIVAYNYTYLPGGDVYNGTRYVATVEIVVPRGVGLLFRNFDTVNHNITSGVIDVDGDQGNGLFSSDRIDRDQDAVPVVGVENLPPGTYPFFCQVHYGSPSGVLRVV